uniref:Uncharacterized protein n=1 Tax=Anguilla anguilla TaxID=7936 RepID=A0A0E9VKL3_ANGAN
MRLIVKGKNDSLGIVEKNNCEFSNDRFTHLIYGGPLYRSNIVH